VVVIVYEIPSLISVVFAAIGHELSMLNEMFVTPAQVLLMPRPVFSILFRRLAISRVHFADVCSVIDISRADFATGRRNVASTESELGVAGRIQPISC
jgi:hypothetical protein